MGIKDMACANCGIAAGSTDPYNRIEADHIIPAVRGGSDDPSNLQPLCGICNRYKSSWTNEEVAKGFFPQWRKRPDLDAAEVHYPTDFDRINEEWVTQELPAKVRATADRIHAEGDADLARSIIMDAILNTTDREEVRTPTLYIYGKIFDVPVRPEQAAEWVEIGIRSVKDEQILPISSVTACSQPVWGEKWERSSPGTRNRKNA